MIFTEDKYKMVKELRGIANSFPNERIKVYAEEVEYFLAQHLGRANYENLRLNSERMYKNEDLELLDETYKTILLGGTYTRKKELLTIPSLYKCEAYYIFSFLVKNQAYTVSGQGVEKKKSDLSTPASEREIIRLSRDAAHMGALYLSDIKKYMNFIGILPIECLRKKADISTVQIGQLGQ